MTNLQLTAVTFVVLAAHIGAAAASLIRKRWAAPMLALNATVGAVVLAYLAAHPRLFAAPIDWQIITLGIFESVVVLAAAMAARGVRPALAISWVAFVVHFATSAGAVAFALLFKITRLI